MMLLASSVEGVSIRSNDQEIEPALVTAKYTLKHGAPKQPNGETPIVEFEVPFDHQGHQDTIA